MEKIDQEKTIEPTADKTPIKEESAIYSDDIKRLFTEFTSLKEELVKVQRSNAELNRRILEGALVTKTTEENLLNDLK